MQVGALHDDHGDRWFRSLPLDELGALLRPLLVAAYGCWERAAGTAHEPLAWYRLLVGALQAEARACDEAVTLAGFCLNERPSDPTTAAQAALETALCGRVLQRFVVEVHDARLATPEIANAWLGDLRRHFRETEGLRGKAVMDPIRAALTGDMVGPCLGNVTTLLGAERCRQRAQAALVIATDRPGGPDRPMDEQG